jgi:hypothetical protein
VSTITHTSNHFGDDNHVAQVGLDDRRLVPRCCLLLSFSELLDERHGLAFQPPLETTAGTGMDDIDQLIGGQVEEVVELHRNQIRKSFRGAESQTLGPDGNGPRCLDKSTCETSFACGLQRH